MTRQRCYLFLYLYLNLGGYFISIEALSTAALLYLLQRHQSLTNQHRANQRSTPRLQWSAWEQWTLCSSSTTAGVRVRSRGCTLASCDRIPGMNFETQTCNMSNRPRAQRKTEYMNMCTNNGMLNTTMSCRLYMENPELAQTIYQSSGCVFEMADASRDPSERSNVVFGRNPVTNSGEISLRQPHQEGMATSNLETGRFNQGTGQIVRTQRSAPDINQSTQSTILSSLAIARYCTDICSGSLVTATGVAALGYTSARTVADVLFILSTNPLLKGNAVLLQMRYNVCTQECATLGSRYGTTGLILAQQRQTNVAGLRVTFNLGEGTGLGRKKRDAEWEQRARSKRSESEEQKSRVKRQSPPRYWTPCYEQRRTTSDPRVLRLDGTLGELFFFENNQQRFIHTLCLGRSLGTRGLYSAAELVTHDRTQQPAICRQGYLQRFGLMIFPDVNGTFSFRSGESFTVRLEPFLLESHCALSVPRVG
ncbi:uncharacterized protein LOC100179307 [Ciona intestinalis]